MDTESIPDCFTCADELDRQSGRSFLLCSWWTSRMYVCPTCGNKRCPKASKHTLGCTGSNEPGQAGSVYH